MNHIAKIIEKRKGHIFFNVPQWLALYQDYPALIDMPDTDLRSRLEHIEKNIQFLDRSTCWNDALSAEHGWQSPWWWFRARQWSLCEFERRGMISLPAQNIAVQTQLHPHLLKRKKPFAVRISKLRWLSELMEGNVRFSSASSYIAPALLASQQDDEISRHTFLPGSLATITTENGLRLPLTGQIRLSGSRTWTNRAKSAIRPYWLLCFSMEPDIRLLKAFQEENAEDQGFLVLFDLEKFHRRVAEAVQPLRFDCGRVKVDYYDEHFPPPWAEGQFHVIGLKLFRFAYQRELRFFLLHEDFTTQSFNSHVGVQAEKMNDIGGLYNSTGEKVAGVGPKRLFS